MTDECKPNCDYSKAVQKGRARWCCAKCGRDFGLEYLFWYEATQQKLTTDELNEMWHTALKYANPTAGDAHLRYARAIESKLRGEL